MFGGPKFARLNALKISVRNWIRRWSSTRKSFANVKSKFAKPGPRMMPTPAFPNACGDGLNAGENASVLNHR